MRGKIITLTMMVVTFLIGGGTMYYLMNEVEENNINISNQSTYTTGVIKCSNDITIDETGISTAVGEIYDATVTIQN